MHAFLSSDRRKIKLTPIKPTFSRKLFFLWQKCMSINRFFFLLVCILLGFSFIRICVFSHNFLDPVNERINSGVVSVLILLCTAFTPAEEASYIPSVLVAPFSFTNKGSSTVTYVISSFSISNAKRHRRIE